MFEFMRTPGTSRETEDRKVEEQISDLSSRMPSVIALGSLIFLALSLYEGNYRASMLLAAMAAAAIFQIIWSRRSS